MAPEEAPLRCLAVRVMLDEAEADGEITVPVVVPEAIAVKAILADLTNDPPRILFDHALSGGQTRKWRWVASHTAREQGRGRFPWEAVDA